MDPVLIAGAVAVGVVPGAIVMWLVMRTRAEARIAGTGRRLACFVRGQHFEGYT
jgi:hypothetical protein